MTEVQILEETIREGQLYVKELEEKLTESEKQLAEAVRIIQFARMVLHDADLNGSVEDLDEFLSKLDK